MRACFKCGTIADVKFYSTGLVALCARCQPRQEECGASEHDWRGSGSAGTWVCLRCQKTLGSQAIELPIDASVS